MSSLVGKTMAGFLSFFFFLSPEAEIPSSFCHNKGDRGGGNGSEQHRGSEARRSGDVMEGGEGLIYCITWAV